MQELLNKVAIEFNSSNPVDFERRTQQTESNKLLYDFSTYFFPAIKYVHEN